jgi:hypothetical protein
MKMPADPMNKLRFLLSISIIIALMSFAFGDAPKPDVPKVGTTRVDAAWAPLIETIQKTSTLLSGFLMPIIGLIPDQVSHRHGIGIVQRPAKRNENAFFCPFKALISSFPRRHSYCIGTISAAVARLKGQGSTRHRLQKYSHCPRYHAVAAAQKIVKSIG